MNPKKLIRNCDENFRWIILIFSWEVLILKTVSGLRDLLYNMTRELNTGNLDSGSFSIWIQTSPNSVSECKDFVPLDSSKAFWGRTRDRRGVSLCDDPLLIIDPQDLECPAGIQSSPVAVIEGIRWPFCVLLNGISESPTILIRIECLCSSHESRWATIVII